MVLLSGDMILRCGCLMRPTARPDREGPQMAGPHAGLLSWKRAALYLSLSESSLRRLVKGGKLAPPIEVTAGRKAFVYEDVEGFRQELIARSRRS